MFHIGNKQATCYHKLYVVSFIIQYVAVAKLAQAFTVTCLVVSQPGWETKEVVFFFVNIPLLFFHCTLTLQFIYI